MFFERQGLAEWSFGPAFEVDGAVVQTYGPTTDEDGVVQRGIRRAPR